MDVLSAQLQGKLKVLSFTLAKTDAVIAKNDVDVSDRQRSSLATMIKAVTTAKETIEEHKFEKGDSGDEVTKWGEPIEEVITDADANVRRLTSHIQEIASEVEAAERAEKRKAQLEFERAQYDLQRTHEQHERDCQIEQEEKLLQQKLKYQQMLDEAHPEQQKEQPPKDINAAKLPKLSIMKFNGSFSDWLRFWNQFLAVIENQNVSKVTKFAYLKELLEPNIRTSIDGLPFTEEGYAQAKEILLEKYGNDSEIINAYVEEIVALPTINGTQPNKIHPFFEKLRYSVQSVAMLKKLDNVNGYVRMTLNKIPGIRGDLVRTDGK